jgi:hypothetical protein
MNEYLQRMAIYGAMGIVLASVDLHWDMPVFWCTLALFWLSNYLERREGLEVGIASGIEMMADMTDEQRNEVIALVKQAQKDDDNE